ncbi:MAG TPA: hypothetical protein GXZ24_08550 [Firmicutes bacterium]|nr:hypothetical protein [Bacillota bacterium]
MPKNTRSLILFLLLTLLLLAMFTFLLSYSWSPREEEAPKRSRPVISLNFLGYYQYN